MKEDVLILKPIRNKINNNKKIRIQSKVKKNYGG